MCEKTNNQEKEIVKSEESTKVSKNNKIIQSNPFYSMFQGWFQEADKLFNKDFLYNEFPWFKEMKTYYKHELVIQDETNEDVTYVMDVQDITSNEIKISVDNNKLTITIETEKDDEYGKTSTFSTKTISNSSLDMKTANAVMENGKLKINISKKQNKKPEQIEIKKR